LLKNENEIGASVSLHSYGKAQFGADSKTNTILNQRHHCLFEGQLILTSWGYTDVLPSDNSMLVAIFYASGKPQYEKLSQLKPGLTC